MKRVADFASLFYVYLQREVEFEKGGMSMAKRHSARARFCPGGRRYIDWMFRRLIKTLEKVKLYKNKNLRDPKNRLAHLYGYLHQDENGHEIYLGYHGRRGGHPVKTLIHECLHILVAKELPEVSAEKEERWVLAMEASFFLAFSGEQLKILRSYIPRHYVKRHPPK